jgi:hypothetical protein
MSFQTSVAFERFRASSVRSCEQLFDEFLAHCESRRAKNGLASHPKVDEEPIRDSMLKRTYNNAYGVLRFVFKFEFRVHPEMHNKAPGKIDHEQPQPNDAAHHP